MEETPPKRDTIIVDRGLASGGQRVHGLNRVLLMEKILREKVLDSQYWHVKASQLQFYGLLKECVLHVGCVGTYENSAKTKTTKFVALLLRLLQLAEIPKDVVEWLVVGDHGHVYLSVLFMVYVRLVFEDSAEIWKLLERKYNEYDKVRYIENGRVTDRHIDEIADGLLMESHFVDMTLPRLVRRWVLEEKGQLEERESLLADEFEEMVEKLEQEEQQKES